MIELRAASAVPDDAVAQYEGNYKKSRFAALAAEYSRMATHLAAEQAAALRLGVAASDLRFAIECDPIPAAPDGYKLAIEKLRNGR